jgi:prepilin-type N-terminal cleavage/methylation domain-containing protein
MSVIRRRLRGSDERGFTLVEMLVAMTIGVIILMAAFMLLDRSFSASGKIADREDALQRGRQTMELMTRQLRSQVCVGTANVPMVSGTDNSVTWYGSLAESSTAVTKRTLTFDAAAASGHGSITESVVTGVPNPAYPNMSFTGAAVTKTLMTDVKQVEDSAGPPAVLRPVFKYYRFKAGAPKGDLEQLTTPLASADLGRVALIKVAFRSYAIRPLNKDNDATVLEDDVFIRVSDPTEVQEGPQCI